MTQEGYTIRSEEERNAVNHLRNAVYWRVKFQLAGMASVTLEQYRALVAIAVNDAHAAAQEVTKIFPMIESYQKAGWKPYDCFDQAAAQAQTPPPPPQPQAAQPAPAAAPPQPGQPQPGQPQPGQPQAGQPQKAELDNLGKDLEKGLKDIGGALEGLFGQKKK